MATNSSHTNTASTTDVGYSFEGLKAVYINCTLKKSPEVSNTQGLMDTSIRLMRDHGVQVDNVRLVDHDIALGVYPATCGSTVGRRMPGWRRFGH